MEINIKYQNSPKVKDDQSRANNIEKKGAMCGQESWLMKNKYVLSMLLAMFVSPLTQAKFEGIKVMALAQMEGRAVIRTSDGSNRVVGLEDHIEGARVAQVLTDKLVLIDDNNEVVWLYKTKGNQPSDVKRFARELPRNNHSGQQTSLTIVPTGSDQPRIEPVKDGSLSAD